jgi:glycosyltransferase involved in cell wall biosynthesis
MKIVLDDFQPDVVHLNNFNFQLTPSIIYAIEDYEKETNKKIKLIYTAHDYQLVCPNHMMYNNDTVCESCIGGNFSSCTKGKCIHASMLKSLLGTIEAKLYDSKKTYNRIDTIICCSEFMKTKLDTNPIFKNKTVVMHNFIDSVEQQDVQKEDYILYFGRFSKEKGIDTLIGAKDINFICAGSGPMEDEINSSPNLKNVGFKSGKELEMLIRKARCTVYPSIWYENCPFSVMESIMYGTPVVASNIGGIPELIENGKTGFLFEPSNIDDFKKKLSKISLENSDNFAQNCKSASFDTVESYCKKLLKIYGEI